MGESSPNLNAFDRYKMRVRNRKDDAVNSDVFSLVTPGGRMEQFSRPKEIEHRPRPRWAPKEKRDKGGESSGDDSDSDTETKKKPPAKPKPKPESPPSQPPVPPPPSKPDPPQTSIPRPIPPPPRKQPTTPVSSVEPEVSSMPTVRPEPPDKPVAAPRPPSSSPSPKSTAGPNSARPIPSPAPDKPLVPNPTSDRSATTTTSVIMTANPTPIMSQSSTSGAETSQTSSPESRLPSSMPPTITPSRETVQGEPQEMELGQGTLKTGQLAGIVAGAVTFGMLALLFAGFWYRRCKKRRRAKQLEVEQVWARHALPPSEGRLTYFLKRNSTSSGQTEEVGGSFDTQWDIPSYAGPLVARPQSVRCLSPKDIGQDPFELPADSIRVLPTEERRSRSKRLLAVMSHYSWRD